jgi:hypothetical protein
MTTRNWLLIGTPFIAVALVLVLVVPNPTPAQNLVFRVILALGAAFVSVPIMGSIGITMPFVTATGAIAVFVLVYVYTPAFVRALKSRSSMPRP